MSGVTRTATMSLSRALSDADADVETSGDDVA
jgi:hypothetical protein